MNHFYFFEDGEEFSEHQDLLKQKHQFEAMLKNREALYLEPDTLENLYIFYRIHHEQEHCKELLEYAIEVHPHYEAFYLYKYEFLLQLEKHSEALEWVENCIAHFPDISDFWIKKASLLVDINQEDASHFLNYIMSEGFSFEPLEMLEIAKIYEKLGNLEKTKEYILRCYQSKEFDAHSYLFTYLETHENYEFAESIYQYLLNHDPFDAKLWYELALFYSDYNEAEQAMMAIDYALALDDSNTQYLAFKVELLIENQQYQEALKFALELSTLEPDEETNLEYIAVLYENLENYDQARKYYKKILDLDEEFIIAYHGIARCLVKLERFTEAITYLEKALSFYQDEETTLLYIDLLIHVGLYETAYQSLSTLREKFTELSCEYETEFLIRDITISYCFEEPDIVERMQHFIKLNIPSEYGARLAFHLAGICFAMNLTHRAYYFFEIGYLRDKTQMEYLHKFFPDILQKEEVQLILSAYQ